MAAGITHLRKAAPPLSKWVRSFSTTLNRPAPPLPKFCFGSSQNRSFGASAAIDYQYDYYEEDEEEEGKTPLMDTEGLFSKRGVQWVFIGNPGSKKHLYAEKLSKLLEIPHISMGSLVRQELHPRSSLYKQIANSVNQGKLVPENIIFGLLSKRLEEGYYRGENGFILDGIPRNHIQAEILDQIADIDLVVNFKCMEDCSVKRRLGSSICSYCQESITGNSGATLLKLNSHPAQMALDTEDTRKQRLHLYAEQRKSLEDYYKKQKKLLNFQVSNGHGETWQGLLTALHLQHMNAIHKPHKLML